MPAPQILSGFQYLTEHAGEADRAIVFGHAFGTFLWETHTPLLLAAVVVQFE